MFNKSARWQRVPREDDQEKLSGNSKQMSRERRWPYLVISHALVFCLTFFYAKSVGDKIDHDPDMCAKSSGVITPMGIPKYHPVLPDRDAWGSSLYLGEPSEASEKAWNALLGPRASKLSPEEAEELKVTDGLYLDDGNILTIPAVLHNLHCIRRLRQTFFEDYYYPNATEKIIIENRGHNFHCLEVLRLSMMCHPDLAPLPYWWSGDEKHELSVRPNVLQRCADWDDLEEQFWKRDVSNRKLVDIPAWD